MHPGSDEEGLDAEERAASSEAETVVEKAATDDEAGGQIQPLARSSAPAEAPVAPQNPNQMGTNVTQINATAQTQQINNAVNGQVQHPSWDQLFPRPSLQNGRSGQNRPHQNPGFGYSIAEQFGIFENPPQPNAGLLPNATPSTAVVQGMPPAGLPQAPVDAGEIVRHATQGATDSVMNGMIKIMGSVLNTVAGSTSKEAVNVRISDHQAIDTLGPASRAALAEGDEQELEDGQMTEAGSLVPTRLLTFPTRRLLLPPVDSRRDGGR
ncbi:hypothetical protein PV04_07118 [Phialophora macrospora]|uniref:Uncharacterized protein n=1 Tax=Phialophora macrospora TaxID=1851006 RepID=A0A0D2FIK6_9EURO|nr:hypothetical protein PV04_07118 [Phialophora macrospora]